MVMDVSVTMLVSPPPAVSMLVFSSLEHARPDSARVAIINNANVRFMVLHLLLRCVTGKGHGGPGDTAARTGI
jgi:hypothetical protein